MGRGKRAEKLGPYTYQYQVVCWRRRDRGGGEGGGLEMTATTIVALARRPSRRTIILRVGKLCIRIYGREMMIMIVGIV